MWKTEIDHLVHSVPCFLFQFGYGQECKKYKCNRQDIVSAVVYATLDQPCFFQILCGTIIDIVKETRHIIMPVGFYSLDTDLLKESTAI